MNTLTITEARQKLCNIVNEMNEGHAPVHIKGKKSDVVLMSAKDYSGMKETLYLMSIPGLWERIKEAQETPISECISWEDLKWE